MKEAQATANLMILSWKIPYLLIKWTPYFSDNHTASLDSKSDNQLEWELLKVKIKDFTRNYSKQKSVHNRNTLAELYGKLNDTDSALAVNPECVATKNQRDQVKIKIQLLEQQKSRAVQVRSRVKRAEEWGKTQSIFWT